MSNIIPFSFDSHSVRVITDDNGELWFVGKDICDALGYADPKTAMRSHCKGVQKLHPLQTPGGIQELRVLSEPDALRLIVGSTLPSADRFEKWVFEDVLPTIRKTGSYQMPKQPAPKRPTITQSARDWKAVFGIARLIGLDKNVAAVSANQPTYWDRRTIG